MNKEKNSVSLITKKYKKRSQIGSIFHSLRQNKGAMAGLIIVALIIIAFIASLFISWEAVTAMNARDRFTRPGLKYLFGTDSYGRDLFLRVIYGTRYTLAIGFGSVAFGAFFGVSAGCFAGYYGGTVDIILMRVMEIVNSMPFFPIAIILSAIIGNSISDTGRVIMIMFILGLLSWPGLARLTRGQILAERANEYVTAARALGIKEFVIIFRHILPNVMPVVLVSLTLSLASSMLIESSLSFVGFGIREPNPTWGNMLSATISSEVITNMWWRWVFPAAALGLSVLSINTVGDGFRDAIDPKSNDR